MKQVTSYVRENIGAIDTAQEVAEILDVSYETFRKRFRREQGIPIGEYIRQTRIDEARRLLIETDDPVYVVCWEVGFSSDSSGDVGCLSTTVQGRGRGRPVTTTEYQNRTLFLVII
jgi:transcriptional regulator GlxA family with amidase domain